MIEVRAKPFKVLFACLNRPMFKGNMNNSDADPCAVVSLF